jgi:hypothetical protein
MFVAPPIRVPADADSDMMKQKQAEMQAALERVRDLAESWFGLTNQERERLWEEWSEYYRPARRDAPLSQNRNSPQIRQA